MESGLPKAPFLNYTFRAIRARCCRAHESSAAAGVNPIDWKIRQGLMKEFRPVTFPYTPGIELAGVVEDVGPTVTAFEIGQAVFGQIAEGAYAEYLTVPVEALALKPKILSFVEAATVPVG